MKTGATRATAKGKTAHGMVIAWSASRIMKNPAIRLIARGLQPDPEGGLETERKIRLEFSRTNISSGNTGACGRIMV